MRRRAITRRRTIIGGLLVGTLSIALFVGAMIVPGYQSLAPDLDDGTVWLANPVRGQIGAANTAAATLQSVSQGRAGDAAIVQSDAGVLFHDRASSTVRSIDPASGDRGPAVPIAAGSLLTATGGRVLIVNPDTGDVWVTTMEAIAEGDPPGEPVIELGVGGTAALAGDEIVAASPGLRRVLTIDADSGETVRSDDAPMSPSEPSLSITAVGERWVLLDATSGVLSSREWNARLAKGQAVLQQPSAAADGVLVSVGDSLLKYTFGVAAPTVLASGATGDPVAPAVHDDCTYAVWRDGTAWRDCRTGDATVLKLADVDQAHPLAIVARGSAVALADGTDGTAWAIDRDGARIDDWQSLPTELPEQTPQPDGGHQTSADEEVEQVPPEARDDELGARPGRVTMLPVLANDTDGNGDALMIVDVSGPEELSITPDGRTVRLDAPAEASGAFAFEYTVDDGAGGTDSASAVVTYFDKSVNNPPQQVRPSSVQLSSGVAGVASVLEDWIDPEGDPLVVTSATDSAGLAIARADGRIQLGGEYPLGVHDVALVVSDGRASAEGALTVAAVQDAALVANPITRIARVGERLSVDPLLAASGGAATVSLHNVGEGAGLDITPDYVRGTIGVVATDAGERSFDYVVTDGAATATSSVRILVLPSVDASTAPVTMQHTAAVVPLGQAEIPVGDLDLDPAGGLLLVSSVTSPTSAVSANVVDQGSVRLELRAPLSEPVVVEYTVTNGVTAARGTILVVERSGASTLPPIARDDRARVSVGGAVDIDVLGNDEHPDGLRIELDDTIVSEPEQGLLFTDGSRLRFVAPASTGTFTGVYRVIDSEGSSAQATVTIVVARASAETNAPPVAADVDARVIAGERVDIQIPLANTDPNGDAVQLLGQSSPASLGSLSQVGTHTFRYRAGQYASGTDSVEYTIVDSQGARSTGTIRIGVAESASEVLPPLARADSVSMRPDSSLAINVTANDDDPAGLALRVTDATTADSDANVAVVDSQVVVRSSQDEGTIGVVYTVENARGASSPAWLLVTVSEDAVPPAPRARDVRVPLQSIIDADQVTVAPLDRVELADGETDQLELSVPVQQQGVSIRGNRLDVEVRDEARIVPFTITRADTGAASTALAFVPGKNDSLPALRAGLEPIEVVSGERLELDINDYVVAVDGGPVFITDASTVSATNSNGKGWVVDNQTLQFESADGYFGPANVAFEVTDGSSPTDPAGRKATLVLPIEVLPNEQVPPRILSTTLQMEPNTERTLDLTRLTAAANEEQLERVTWSLVSVPNGLNATLEGALLSIRTATNAPTGSSIPLTLRATLPGVGSADGTVTTRIITSTRPLAQAIGDRLELVRGTAETLNVLANDESTNPFPEPLQLERVAGPAGGLPQGIGTAADRGAGTVTVTASTDARVTSFVLRYRVLDATGDPARAVWGNLTVVIQDVPQAPSPPTLVTDSYTDGELTLRIAPGSDNNSPITGYAIGAAGGYRHDCGASTLCTLTDLQPGRDYNFVAYARNAIGESIASGQSAPMHVDRLPGAVSGITTSPTTTAGSTLISWQRVPRPSGGTAVNGYLVRVNGPGVDRTDRVPADQLQYVAAGLTPGAAYTVDVAATNAAGVSNSAWRWSGAPVAFTAVGTPGTTRVLISNYNAANGTVSASWAPAPAAGGSQVLYRAEAVPAGTAPACVSGGNGNPAGSSSLSASNLPVPQGSRMVVAVTADNGWFCSVSLSPVVSGVPDPVQPGTEISGEVRDNARDLRVTALPQLAQGAHLQVRQNFGGTRTEWARVAVGDYVSPGSLHAGYPYGQSGTLEVRQCIIQSGQTVCSATTNAGSAVAHSLRATISGTCTIGQTPTFQLPQNSGSAAGSVAVQYRVRGALVDAQPGDPVPIGATEISVTGVVQYQGEEWRDPKPELAPCGLS